jgi:hypothetical protein
MDDPAAHETASEGTGKTRRDFHEAEPNPHFLAFLLRKRSKSRKLSIFASIVAIVHLMARPDIGTAASKFEEIQSVLQNTKNEKTAQKLYKDLRHICARLPAALQFERGAAMLLARFTRDAPNALQIARKLAATVTDPTVVREIAITFQHFLLQDDLIALYTRLIKEFPADLGFLTTYFIVLLCAGRYPDAQQTGMSLIRQRKAIPHFLYEAFASFLLAEQTGNRLFYEFVPRFVDQANTQNYVSVVELKVHALLKLGRADDAVAYLRSPALSDLFSVLGIAMRRLELEALLAAGRTDEVGVRAADFLANVESDSLEEWRLAVQFAPDINELFERYDDGRHRSVWLMRIERAIAAGEDALPHIAGLVLQHAGKPWLFSDIKRYLSDPVCAGLADSRDAAVRAYATGAFDGVVQDPRTAIIAAQFAILQFADGAPRDCLESALAVIAPFAEPSVRVMAMRLRALLGDTAGAMTAWRELKLEAISYLSCGALVLVDLLRAADISQIKAFATATSDYCRIGLSHMLIYVQLAINAFNFTQAAQTFQLKKDIERNLVRYLCFAFELLVNPDTINEINTARFVSNAELAQFETKTDTSIVEIYFRDPRVTALIFPDAELRDWALLFNALAQLLYGVKVKDAALVAEMMATIAVSAVGGDWATVIAFAQGGAVSADAVLGPFQMLALKAIAKLGRATLPEAVTAQIRRFEQAEKRNHQPVDVPTIDDDELRYFFSE